MSNRIKLPRGGVGGPPARRRVSVFLRDLVVIVLAALVISFVVKSFAVQSFSIPSASMENTLMPGDRVVVCLLSPRLVPLQRGDVVVFTDPGGWLAEAADGDHVIKRVIGLPGDTVACCNRQGRLTVDGVPVVEPYANVSPIDSKSDPDTFRVAVPPGKLWLMGDNRDDSRDSAYHVTAHDASPFVPINDVVGKALVIDWPLTRWTVLGNYPTVFSRVERPVE